MRSADHHVGVDIAASFLAARVRIIVDAMERKPRVDEQAALDAICAVEDVERFEWLVEGPVPTADLEVTIGGRVVTVEITLSTSAEGNALRSVSEKMRSPERSDSWPQSTSELSHMWTVHVSDYDSESGRRLKELMKVLIAALAEVENTRATPEEMERHAAAMLDPDPYNPNRSGPKSDWWLHGWHEAAKAGTEFNEYVETDAVQHCGYWYPPDMVDCITKSLRPRRVTVLKPPNVSPNGIGGVAVFAASMQPGFLMQGVDFLVPAIQNAVHHKANRKQMANVSGDKWLVIALDGDNAAGQLEELCSQEPMPHHLEIANITFPMFDEVWVFARTFHGKRHAVLRLTKTSPNVRCFTVPRPDHET